ncbi:LEAF RUST 10 DISEASE-RESISTANCE LOCUS RECEPTOR-LIKE PROTEIN KINASE-like 1.2 isoform X4 [Setaria italica]|nr:LEAF RUST 10 DISEASE-RESISTANCE LOCUS RECEPTOR-LIKE PROTEIN KINASE-like 1.2 isoform X4 [Setaria italica]
MAPSSLLLFLVSAVPVMLAAGEEHCPTVPVACGKVNITFPFAIVPDETTETSCGLIGFQVRCLNNNPYLGYNNRLYGHQFQILDIFYNNASLLLADVHKLQDFNNSASEKCHAPTNNSSNKLGLPFSISPINQNLIFYNCMKPLSEEERWSRGLVETTCGNRTFVRVAGRSDGSGSYGSYFLEGCSYTVVPVLARYGHANASNYKELISDGFLLTWEAPLKSGGSNRKIMIVSITCGTVGGILAVGILIFVWHKRKRRKQVGAPNGFMRSESSMQSYSKDLELGGSLHIFTYEELEEATDGFSDSRELGDGGFGTVYKGKLRDGRVVAVKRLYKNNYKRVEQFINEVDILSRLLHQNLVILYGCTSRSSRDLMLVYEYIPNGTVADHLHGPRASERGLTWPVRMNIAIETAEALAYLHAVEIIHRDVKTNNILLDNSFHVKVADFGLSRLYPLEVTHVSTVPQGTPGYVDPVYHQCYKLTDKSDVYSFGVVLVELISSKPAVDMGRSHSEINLANMALNRIQNHEVEQLVDPELGYETDDETKRMVDLVAELAFQCLQLERELRPSIKQVVEALNCIKNGDSPEKRMDLKSSPKEDSHLLKNSVQYSPDSVIHKFHSQSTTHSVASNASG